MLIQRYIHTRARQYICPYTCTNTKDSRQPRQTIILSSLCRPDPSVLPFFLFLPFYFPSLDIYLGIHLSAYLYIDVSIYLFYLPDLLFLAVRSHLPLEFTGTLSFTPLSLFWNFVFPLLFPGHILFSRQQPKAIVPLNLFCKLFYFSLRSCT